jgi:hypothetical protein
MWNPDSTIHFPHPQNAGVPMDVGAAKNRVP